MRGTDVRPPNHSQPGVHPRSDEVPPAIIYGGLMLVAAILIALRFPPSNFRIFLLFTACVALQFTLRMCTATAMLLLIQAALFFADRQRFFGSTHSSGEILIAGAVVLLLMSSGRFLTLGVPLIPWNATLRTTLDRIWKRFVLSRPQTVDRTRLDARCPSSFRTTEVFTAVLRVGFAVFVATELLEFVPLDPNAPDYARLVPPALRAILIGLGLLAASVSFNTILSVLSWRRITPGEARVYLNSQLSQECHREISAVFNYEQHDRRRRRS